MKWKYEEIMKEFHFIFIVSDVCILLHMIS